MERRLHVTFQECKKKNAVVTSAFSPAPFLELKNDRYGLRYFANKQPADVVIFQAG
jgi:hypothetical protein